MFNLRKALRLFLAGFIALSILGSAAYLFTPTQSEVVYAMVDPPEEGGEEAVSTRVECEYYGGIETSVATCDELESVALSKESQGVCEASNLPGIDVTDQDTNNNEQDACDCEGEVLASGNCDIVGALEAGLNILTGAAGLAVVGGIMHGAYLYMTGRDNPGQIGAARSKIVWALVALLILLFFWGFLQWLIPGGLLGGGTPTGFF